MSLVELIVFIVIIGIGLAGTMTVMNYGVMHSADPVEPKQALAAAESVLEEQLQLDFANLADVAVTDLMVPSGYKYSVTVTQPAASPFADVTATADIRQVTVTVTHSNQSYSLSGYRLNYE